MIGRSLSFRGDHPKPSGHYENQNRRLISKARNLPKKLLEVCLHSSSNLDSSLQMAMPLWFGHKGFRPITGRNQQ